MIATITPATTTPSPAAHAETVTATVTETAAQTVAIGVTHDAITIPPAFGQLVLTELGICMLAGPVIAGSDTDPWTFLTQIANVRCPAVPAELRAYGVRLVPAGERVALPDGSGSHSWVDTDREPAIWSTVIGAARRVAARLAATR